MTSTGHEHGTLQSSKQSTAEIWRVSGHGRRSREASGLVRYDERHGERCLRNKRTAKSHIVTGLFF